MSGFVAESGWRHPGLGRGSRYSGHWKAQRTAICCRQRKVHVQCENAQAAGVGAPDVVKATCPVRGALDGIPLPRGNMDAVLRLHELREVTRKTADMLFGPP